MAETEQIGGPGMQRAGQSGAAVASSNSAAKALAIVSTIRERVMAMPAGKRTWLLASVVFLAAMGVSLIWFAGRPDWRVLFSGLDGKDVQQVSQELAAAGIPYEMTVDGAGIQVPAEMLDKARMEVAAKGMPLTGRLGFELFDKPNWVGSEFDERVNYQRALEGELEHTIGTLGAVKSARVHLVLPQPSLFAAEEKVAKASVVLKLKRASVDSEQADAIRSLVAGSVENLSVDQVTLVDADGRVSFKQLSSNTAEADAQEAMEAKLVAMLEPLAGRDNVRATVNVTYDEGSEQRTDEVYDPSEVATLTMEKSEQTSAQRGQASGVPGTASNSPGGSPAGAVAGSAAAAAPGTPPLLQKPGLPVYPQGSGGGQSLRQENDTYGVTKHLVHTEEGPGRVRRVSAAVVVNDRSIAEGVGKQEHMVWKPRSADEMHRLEQLAQAAVGYDARRGDQVVMQNVSFSTNAPEIKPPLMDRLMEEARGLLRAEPELMRTAMIGLCGVLLVLFVLRPVARQVRATLRDPLMLAAGSVVAGVSEQPREQGEAMETAMAEETLLSRPKSKTYQLQQGIFEHVSEHIRREPAQSTRLLEAWIGSSGGEELMGATAQFSGVEAMRQNPLLLTPEAGFVPAEMPGLRKAAILMIAIGDELAKTLFQSLSETDVQRVTDEITRLGDVPAAQLTQVLTEFYGLLETQQYMVRGGPDYAMRLLTEAFGAARAEELLQQVRKIRERNNGDMAKLQDMDPQHLSKFLESEHSQTVALVLAHLDAKRASIVLMNLQGAMRVDVVRRLAEMRQFSPEMAQTVAMALHRRMEKMGSSGSKSYSGFKAVADLLNRLNQTESRGILEEIEQSEPKVAIGIRELMFVFEDLVTVPAESIREFVSAADKKVLATALKGAKDNVKAHLFRAMSSRAVEMLKEDMEVMGPVRMRDVGLAQQELLGLARQLESEGKMILKIEVDDDLTV